MLFNSYAFVLFLAAVLALHALLRGHTPRKWLLLCASLLFYALWNPPYVLILIAAIGIDWSIARALGRTEHAGRRRALLLVSLGANLGMLAWFKYAEFLYRNIGELCAALGWAWQAPGFSIVLPIGISFYTFASLSYTIDVYRRDVKGDASLLDYALFVSFFPHLVAGPILRAREFLPQLRTPRVVNADAMGWGLTLLVFGLFAKTVLADYVFAPTVDLVYAQPQRYAAMDIWAAVFAFSGQIYYDFAGYSLCAIGLALCFGYAFPDNFRFPYAAAGFSDFWRRWHISLSTWLRDYLYIPLGGNRDGEARTYRNLFLTMLLGGLWHGASWLFVLWGALHGMYLALERAWQRTRHAHAARLPLPMATLLTFLVITLTWIPFRAPDLATMGEMFAGMLRAQGDAALDASIRLPLVLTLLATLCWQYTLRDQSLEALWGRWPRAVHALAIALALGLMYLCSGGDGRAFIYFQF
jgi:D-alanyl-lipoteichoic acid acyltransferase DltB (MBOAT superfamily)